jgi:shikimate kinase
MLILVGFMGVGKTTVGRVFGDLDEKTVLDTDHLLAELVKQPVGEYMVEVGEAVFRQTEADVLRVALKSDADVISTGGGVVELTENIALLRDHQAQVVWLKSTYETNLARLDAALVDRPLRMTQDSDAFKRLWNRRQPLYQSVADVIVDTENKSPVEIAREITQKVVPR